MRQPKPPQKVNDTPFAPKVIYFPKDYSAELGALQKRSMSEERDLQHVLPDGRVLATAHYDPRTERSHIVINPELRDEVRLPWRG